jgi:hypothetical protein
MQDESQEENPPFPQRSGAYFLPFVLLDMSTILAVGR